MIGKPNGCTFRTSMTKSLKPPLQPHRDFFDVRSIPSRIQGPPHPGHPSVFDHGCLRVSSRIVHHRRPCQQQSTHTDHANFMSQYLAVIAGDVATALAMPAASIARATIGRLTHELLKISPSRRERGLNELFVVRLCPDIDPGVRARQDDLLAQVDQG